MSRVWRTRRQMLILALTAWREGWRGGLWRMLLGVWVAAWLAAWFAGKVSLLEADAARWAWSAGIVRLGVTLALATSITYALARAAADRQLDYVAASPIPRPLWLLGTWLGWQAVALACAILNALALSPWMPSVQAWLHWALGHALELMVISAAALWFGLSLRQGAAAMLATLAFVVLARSMTSITLMARASSEASEWHWFVETLHALLPDISRWVTSDVQAASWRALPEAGLYLVLLYALAAVDWARRRL